MPCARVCILRHPAVAATLVFINTTAGFARRPAEESSLLYVSPLVFCELPCRNLQVQQPNAKINLDSIATSNADWVGGLGVLATRLPDSRLIKIKPMQLLIPVLQVLLGFHSHVKDRAVLAAADHLAVHAPLAPLALRPQPAESHLQV